MRGAPHSGLAKLVSRIKSRISYATFGLPGRDHDFHRQNRRKPARCQRIIVSGLMTCSASLMPGAIAKRPKKISRSIVLNVGRFGDCRRSSSADAAARDSRLSAKLPTRRAR